MHTSRLTYSCKDQLFNDSSCDSLLSKNLKLTILSSNASSSTTKVFKFPHMKDDSIRTHNGLKFKAMESNVMPTVTKINTVT